MNRLNPNGSGFFLSLFFSGSTTAAQFSSIVELSSAKLSGHQLCAATATTGSTGKRKRL